MCCYYCHYYCHCYYYYRLVIIIVKLQRRIGQTTQLDWLGFDLADLEKLERGYGRDARHYSGGLVVLDVDFGERNFGRLLA